MTRLLLAAALTLSACHHQDGQAQPTAHPVLFLGDSLTSQSDMQNRWHREVINAGLSGKTSREILERAQKHVEPTPAVVVILAGCNDAWHDLSWGHQDWGTAQDCESNLSAMLDLFPGSTVILCTIPDILPSVYLSTKREYQQVDDQNAWIRAQGHRAIVMDLQAAFAGHPEYLRADGLHFSEAGYQAWRALLAPYLGVDG